LPSDGQPPPSGFPVWTGNRWIVWGGATSAPDPDGPNGCEHVPPGDDGDPVAPRAPLPSGPRALGFGEEVSWRATMATDAESRDAEATVAALRRRPGGNVAPAILFDVLVGIAAVGMLRECPQGSVTGTVRSQGAPYPDFVIDPVTCFGGGHWGCAPGCVLGPRSGDGLIQPGNEDCDDGNTVANDGSSRLCRGEVSFYGRLRTPRLLPSSAPHDEVRSGLGCLPHRGPVT
jgi:cysteine-rich repeat protein